MFCKLLQFKISYCGCQYFVKIVNSMKDLSFHSTQQQKVLNHFISLCFRFDVICKKCQCSVSEINCPFDSLLTRINFNVQIKDTRCMSHSLCLSDNYSKQVDAYFLKSYILYRCQCTIGFNASCIDHQNKFTYNLNCAILFYTAVVSKNCDYYAV